MRNDKKNHDNLLKNLLTVAPKHCDNCGSRYSEEDYRVVKNTSTSTIFHLKCSTCNNAYMLNIMNPVNGVVGAQRTPLNIDIEAGEELQKFAGRPSVSKNEAIDTFSNLNDTASKEELEKLLFN